MRIALVTTSFPRNAEDPSGHFVRSGALALVDRGHEVHVVAPGGSLFEVPIEHGRLTIHRAGGGSLFGWPGAIARAKEAPWRLAGAASFVAGARIRLRRIGAVDRVVAHWIVPSAFPILASTSAPIEVHAHGADVRLLLRAPKSFREAVLRGLLDREATFVFAARTLLRSLAARLPRPLEDRLVASSHVEPPPIDVPDVREEAVKRRASLGLRAGETLAVAACRLVASKRVELAIDAAVALPSKLVVIGDGPERAALEKYAALFGDRVRVLGALPRRETLAWLAAADILLHPSSVEGAPTVVREARALGVPVVACYAGDVAEWSKSDARIAVAAGKAEAIVAEARALLAKAAPR